MTRSGIGVRAFAPHQVWPQVGSRWPAYNVESDQAEGLVMWMPLHGSDVLRSVYRDIIAGRIFTPGGTPSWVGDPDFGTVLQFDSASTEYLHVASAVALTFPITMAGWVYLDSSGAQQTVCSIGDASGTSSIITLNISDEWWGTPRAIAARAGGNYGYSTAGIAEGEWQHAAAVFLSTTSRTGYAHGENPGTNTTAYTPTAPNTTAIGVTVKSGGYERYLDARAADIRIYNHALTDAQVAELEAHETRWELYEIPRSVWAVRWVAAPAAGQPMNLRGTTVPHLRQWQPGVTR